MHDAPIVQPSIKKPKPESSIDEITENRNMRRVACDLLEIPSERLK